MTHKNRSEIVENRCEVNERLSVIEIWRAFMKKIDTDKIVTQIL